jgi:hypothetical protein
MYIKLSPHHDLTAKPYGLSSMSGVSSLKWIGEAWVNQSFSSFYRAATELSGYVRYDYADEDDICDCLDMFR